MTIKEIEQLAEKQWEGCHGCDENDKGFWINGFVHGYLNARIDNIDNQIEQRHNNIANMLIDDLNCHYSDLPSVKSYDAKQQTVVEWLKQQYIERGETLPSGVFQEAKEMYEQEMMNKWGDGYDEGLYDRMNK